MHLIIKHLFHNTADVENEPGSIGLMIMNFVYTSAINHDITKVMGQQ
jgi:hypothetical protein